jgi:hypothetical protein
MAARNMLHFFESVDQFYYPSTISYPYNLYPIPLPHFNQYPNSSTNPNLTMTYQRFYDFTTRFTDMCIQHFFLASERRSTVDVRRRPGYKIWRLFKFEFSEVNIIGLNNQCLVLNDRSIDENLKRRQIL